jgi:hypothetical protein
MLADINTWISYFFAAIWGMVWHFGIGVGIIILALLWIRFMPIQRGLALLIACSTTAALFAYALGVHDEKVHWTVAQQHTQQVEDKARTDAVKSVTAPGVRNNRHDRNNRDK